MINNVGVNHLRNGNISRASHAFQSAIVIILEAATSITEQIQTNILQNNHNDCSLFSLEQRPVTLTGLHNEHCYVYNRPLIVQADLNMLSHEDLDSFVLTFSTVVVFNFALACHQQGNISGAEVSLLKAGQMYSMALQILASKEINNNDCHAVLQCLALNNLAQLHYDRCDYQKSQSCMSTVLDIVTTTICLSDHLDEKESEEIMMNLLYMQPPTAAHAA